LFSYRKKHNLNYKQYIINTVHEGESRDPSLIWQVSDPLREEREIHYAQTSLLFHPPNEALKRISIKTHHPDARNTDRRKQSETSSTLSVHKYEKTNFSKRLQE